MLYPYGFGFGSHWILLIGVPLIIGLIAQFRVTQRLQEVGSGAGKFPTLPARNAPAKFFRRPRFAMSQVVAD